MPRYIDISMPITDGMLSWPSDPDVELKSFQTLAERGSNVSELKTGTHFGTHVDAPKHSLEDGAGVDAYDPDRFLGKAVVVDLTGVENEIGPGDLPGAVPDRAERVLLKTRNSTERLLEQPFTEDYVGLSADAAEWLAERPKLKLVGIDYLAIQRPSNDTTPHTALLSKGIAIVEGLVLTDVPAGEYELVCPPLRIRDGDGAPARAVLRKT